MSKLELPSNRSWSLAWCVRMVAGALALVLGAGVSQAQSLADVARMEEARRKAVKEAAKVYTNRDLRGGDVQPARVVPSPTPAPIEPGASAPAGQPPAEAGKAPAATDAADHAGLKDREYWTDRMTTSREDLARAEVLYAAVQSRINALTTDFVNRDDPAQRTVIAADKQKALDELARLDKERERLKKQILAIQEEARKAGVPAAWVR